ncbi:methyl-accepting chemotaxis protein [Treponema sp.]|uniref:methyl-accepting chemotaxis protein n=1 Tax=Treponema sp. TaxID=166 RepID=UPI0025F900CF|nr:methyl-accepting chemotaxis protein [Treponema sp.]MCR5218504.1 methyl-accepting chemotaxis protein [Treponema sp.]
MKTKELTLTQKIFKAQIKNDFISGIITFFYSSMFVFLTPSQTFPAIIVTLIALGIFIFGIYKPINKMLTGNISQRLYAFKNGNCNSIEERTALYKDLMSLPSKTFKIQTILYTTAIFILSLFYHYLPSIGLDWRTTILSYLACFFGIYVCGTVALRSTEHICISYAKEIIEEGVDNNIFKSKKLYGTSLTVKLVIEIIIPVITTNIITFFVLFQGYKPINYRHFSPYDQIFRIITISIVSLMVTIRVCFNFYKTIKDGLDKLKSSVKEILNDSKSEIYSPTSVSNEMDYNIHIMNQIIKKFRHKVLKASQVGKNVLETTENLSTISTMLSKNSMEQSTDVKEILSTMEDSNSLSKNIANRILNVSEGAENTKKEIETSLEVLKQNISQLDNINTSNLEIINGIKNLGSQIENIGSVVTIINNIADQTRIIAFNAELEAVSAGNEGKNFHIVSTEIRRLATSTMNSIQEIQTFIQNIQESARKLIESSQNETALIEKEQTLSHKLESQFDTIKDTSALTFIKANNISEIVDQQTSSFSQIVITLKQISSGIESFTVSTKNISDTALKMKELSSALDRL